MEQRSLLAPRASVNRYPDEKPQKPANRLNLGLGVPAADHYGIRLPHKRPILRTIAEIMLDITHPLPYCPVPEGLNSPGVGDADSPGGAGGGV